MIFKAFFLLLSLFLVSNACFASDAELSAARFARKGSFTQAMQEATNALNATQTQDLVLLIKILLNSEKDLEVASALIKRNPILAEIFTSKFDSLLTRQHSYHDSNSLVELLPQTPLNQLMLLDGAVRQNTMRKNHEELQQIQILWSQNRFSKALDESILQSYSHAFQEQLIEKKIALLLMHQEKARAADFIKLLRTQKKIFYKEALEASKSLLAAKKFYLAVKADASTVVNKKALAHYFYASALLKENAEHELAKTLMHANYDEFASQWWRLKNIAIRNELRNKNYRRALKLALSNRVTHGADYFESQWLAGFINYSLLGKPKEALPHFQNMLRVAKSSYSIAQSEYWLGRTYFSLKDKKKGVYWLSSAAKNYPHYFYGQLASLELSQDLRYQFVKSKESGKASLFQAQELSNALSWASTLYKIGMKTEAMQIAQYIAKLSLDLQQASELVAQLQSNRPLLILFVKYLSNQGYPLFKASYPNDVDLKARTYQNQKAFYLAVIRQESGFDSEALSSAGAYGLMQLMPETAARCAKELNLKAYDRKDPATNIALGTFYLDKLMSRWDQHYIIAIAAYNAGEGTAKEWIREYGDPRQLHTLHKTLNWLELLPYAETRLYVKKIIENMINYDTAVFSGQKTQKQLLKYFGVQKVF